MNFGARECELLNGSKFGCVCVIIIQIVCIAVSRAYKKNYTDKEK